jgi:hypothetical protein
MPVAVSPVTAAKAPVRSEVGLSAHAMKLWLAAAQYRRRADELARDSEASSP